MMMQYYCFSGRADMLSCKCMVLQWDVDEKFLVIVHVSYSWVLPLDSMVNMGLDPALQETIQP